MEAVGDLTSRAFIAALHRVRSRRGHIVRMYSDNGTNIVGANRIIQEEYRKFVKEYQEEITLQLTRMNIEWHFIPPSAPHFGGIWEAAVKSTKYHLKRTIGETKLTYEEFTTVLHRIEACLNSRPLCSLNEDPHELALTPAHFLVGESLFAQPENDYTGLNANRQRRWQLCQKIQQDFWKIWKNDYLAKLQHRTKWMTEKRNVQVDDIVLIKDERTPPSVWPMGKIVETKKGTDDLVRVVDVRVGKKIYRRPVTKICLLPVSEDAISWPGRDAETNENISASKRQVALHTTTSTGKRSGARWNYLMIMTFMFVIASAIGSFEVQKLQSEPQIYYERLGESSITEGSWSMIFYYELTDYLREPERMHDGILHLNTRCRRAEVNCNVLISQLQRRLTNINERNEILSNSHLQRREKRCVVLAAVGGAVLGGMVYRKVNRTPGP